MAMTRPWIRTSCCRCAWCAAARNTGPNLRLTALKHLKHRAALHLDLRRSGAQVRPLDQPDVLPAAQHQRGGVEGVLLGAEVHRDQALQRLLVDLLWRWCSGVVERVAHTSAILGRARGSGGKVMSGGLSGPEFATVARPCNRSFGYLSWPLQASSLPAIATRLP